MKTLEERKERFKNRKGYKAYILDELHNTDVYSKIVLDGTRIVKYREDGEWSDYMISYLHGYNDIRFLSEELKKKEEERYLDLFEKTNITIDEKHNMIFTRKQMDNNFKQTIKKIVDENKAQSMAMTFYKDIPIEKEDYAMKIGLAVIEFMNSDDDNS